MKPKKPNRSGYAFANMFKNIDDEQKWINRLKKIAKESLSPAE